MPKTSNTILLKHEEFPSDIPIEADGKIHRYTMPFNNGNPPYTKYTSEYQAQAILDDFKQLLAENPQAKIAITYAANNEQAVDIMNGYKTNRCSIDGGGQAQMFMELLKKLELPENQLLKSQIHILPIATSLRAGGDGTVTEDIIKRDMTNIAKHLGAGWTVLGLCNQYTDKKDYAVGGQNSKKVWGETQKNIFIPAMQQMVGGIDDAIQDPDDGFNYLRQAYQAAKSNPLLVNNTSLSPNNLNKINNEFLPSDSSIGVDSNFMEKVDVKDLEALFKTSFTEEKNLEKIKQGYKGTISQDNEDLMHITNKGLICPEVKNKEKQAEIIALTLKLIKTKNNIPEDQPLVVKANNFSAEDLAIIIKALKKQNINIQFDITEEKDQSIIDLIKQQGVLYDKTNPAPAPASKEPVLPALKAASPAATKQPEEEYDVFNIADDGNCLFASIIHQLDTRVINTGKLNMQSLREQIADYISEHWDGGEDGIIFKNFIEEEDQIEAGIDPPKDLKAFPLEDKQKYINHIKTDKTWGNQASIIAASKILNINIATKTKEGGAHNHTFAAPNNPQTQPTIYLLHQPEVHYLSCFAKDDPCNPNNKSKKRSTPQ